MAQKPRHRTWWYPVFEKENKEIQRRGYIGDEAADEFPILFDNQEDAYMMAMGNRLMPKRVNGEVVLNDEGYAQLEDHGKITLIGVKGQVLDWKKVQKLVPPAGMKGSIIAVPYELSLHKQNLKQVLQETDEMYQRHINSPLGRAGGLKGGEPADGTASDEGLLPPAEQGAGS